MPHAIEGEPNLRGLSRALYYIQACAQSHKTSYDPLNMLYLASDEGSYHVLARYLRNDDGSYHIIDGKKVKQAMPSPPANPGPTYEYIHRNNPTRNAADKLKWELAYMYFQENENMDSALIKTFLSLLPATYQTGFAEQLRRNPNMTFRQVYTHFFKQFGSTTP